MGIGLHFFRLRSSASGTLLRSRPSSGSSMDKSPKIPPELRVISGWNLNMSARAIASASGEELCLPLKGTLSETLMLFRGAHYTPYLALVTHFCNEGLLIRFMATIVGQQEGVVRTVSDAPPVHYSVRILNFSLLEKNSVGIYETGTFQAGGYEWKMVLHPQGNKSKDVEDHLSLYLQMVETSTLPPGWEVHAVFRFFLLDQITDKYLALQDAPVDGRRFYKMKTQWGFDRLMTLKAFKDCSNGHLIDDSCVFGAEVFICKENFTGNGESLTMTKTVGSYTHKWIIEDYSKLESKCYESTPFAAGGQIWKIQFYPKGKVSNTHVSLYLVLVDSPSAPIPSCTKLLVDFTISILDLKNSNHLKGKATHGHWFNPSSTSAGWSKYVSQNLLGPKSVYTIGDMCCIEAELSVLGITDAM